MLDQALEKLVRYMAEKKASDLFITVGLPPCLKVNGAVMPITKNKLSQSECEALVLSTMDGDQRRDFKKHKELNYALVSDTTGRFRASAFTSAVKLAWCCGALRR